VAEAEEERGAERMKAITVIQPYAHLIATGVKRVENRTWNCYLRGPIAIHAGKAQKYGGEPVSDIAHSYGVDPTAMTFGAVVAVAEVIACVRKQDVDFGHVPAGMDWLRTHEHMEGPWGIVLANVRRLVRPVPCQGSQLLWHWEPPTDIELVPAESPIEPPGSPPPRELGGTLRRSITEAPGQLDLFGSGPTVGMR
jgi:hypothetical protein